MPITAYKGFDKDMKCRGHQFEVGKTYEHDGPVKACASGFHACESPFDVWSYYGPFESRFALVELDGDTDTNDDDSKVAAAQITISAELNIGDFTRKCVDWLVKSTKGKSDNSGNYAQIGSSGHSAKIGSSGYSAQIGSSGDSAQIGSSGYSAKIGSSGDSAKIGSSGYSAKIGSSGDSAKIGSSGNYAQIGSSGHSAQIGSSGDYAQIGSSGYSAKIGSSGDSAKIDASGENAVIACAAPATARAGKGGAICIPYHDGGRIRFATGYVGEDGIKPNTWYRAKGGKLVETSQ